MDGPVGVFKARYVHADIYPVVEINGGPTSGVVSVGVDFSVVVKFDDSGSVEVKNATRSKRRSYPRLWPPGRDLFDICGKRRIKCDRYASRRAGDPGPWG